MSDLSTNCSGAIIAGFGSPHGDDEAGWRVVELLDQRPELTARVVTVFEMTQLLAELGGCEKLIVIDACRSGRLAGTVSRLVWPDDRIVKCHSNSTHALGVANALRLAEALGRLPEKVVVYGIEAVHCEPGRPMSAEVAQAVNEVEAIVAAEVCEVVRA